MRAEAAKRALTEGPIRRSLIFFALPIFLSNLFCCIARPGIGYDNLIHIRCQTF